MARIEILAGMGTGKTSLAKLLEQKGFHHIEEDFEKNPFLEELYDKDFSEWFEYGVTNLMIHYNGLINNAQQGRDYVFDFSLILDRAYAQTFYELGAINKKELAAYDSVDVVARKQAPEVDLRIFLSCSPEAQKSRILSRGREYEQDISLDFLKMMAKNTQRFLKTRGGDAKVLTIDTEKYDYVNNPKHQKIVMDMVMKAIGNGPANNQVPKRKPNGGPGMAP